MRARLAAALLLLCASPAVAGPTVATVGTTARLTLVAGGLDHPWGLAFLPDGRALVTERPGRLRLMGKDGALSAPLQGVPDVYAAGQGGLLDVAADPAFADNRFVYLTYFEGDAGGADIAVARARLDGERLSGLRVIYSENRRVSGTANLGARLAFAPDGTLFVTLGDRFSHRDEAQDLGSPFGKVIRIRTDGSVPPDNPFVGRAGALPQIWTYGHRNPQGMAVDPATGRLWTVEHGARGGDEINHPEAGKNYGWPVITYGVDYSGARIGIGTAAPGMEQPVFYWDPSIAPSGLAIYTGEAFPAWKGSLFVGALKGKALIRLSREGDRVTREDRLLTDFGRRIRDVRQGPDGFVYLLTDESDGAVLRLEPPA